jgi:hypothetical protein
MNVRKVEYLVPVALDDDGTPLSHGERMVEVEPGHWKSPTTIALEQFLAEEVRGMQV